MKIARGEKKLAAICALAICVPLAVAAFIGHINATPTIAATPPVKAPNPNGYDLYVAASNAIRLANPAVDAILEIRTVTDPKIRAQRYSLTRKNAWLAQNQAGFALFERAQKADSLGPPICEFGLTAPRTVVRQMARYKVVESNAHWMRSEHNAALQSGLDIVQMGYDFQRGGDALSFLTGDALNHMSIRTTSDTIEHLDAKQARLAARRLEKLLATRWTLAQALAADRHRVRQKWIERFEKPDWRTRALDFRLAFKEPLSWKDRARAQTISKRQIIADLDALYDRAISYAVLPYNNDNLPQMMVGDPFFTETRWLLSSIPLNEARALTADRVLMLRLALRAHQIEHGAPPPTLQALVPNYIAAVPDDPFGKGEPLRYKSDGKTYQLWSIGPDGRDDGGKPIGWLKNAPKIYADQRERLPWINDDSLGDYVAGKNQ